MHEPDEKDYLILDVLRENSSLSIQKIAKKTGIPIATVHNRIKKLKEEGIIKKYTIILDKGKLGKKMVAFIGIKAAPRADHVAMLKEISKNSVVEECAVVAGQMDLVVKARVKDMDELNQFVLHYLRKLESVADTSTMIAYQMEEKV